MPLSKFLHSLVTSFSSPCVVKKELKCLHDWSSQLWLLSNKKNGKTSNISMNWIEEWKKVNHKAKNFFIVF